MISLIAKHALYRRTSATFKKKTWIGPASSNEGVIAPYLAEALLAKNLRDARPLAKFTPARRFSHSKNARRVGPRVQKIVQKKLSLNSMAGNYIRLYSRFVAETARNNVPEKQRNDLEARQAYQQAYL